jgi:hypothetical protein
VKLGGLLTAAYTHDDDNQITLRSFVYQNAIDETTASTGFVGGAGSPPARLSILRYTLESLGFAQLAGHHKFDEHFIADWRTVISRTDREEPDTRLTQYIQSTEPPKVYSFSNSDDRGGFRFENSTLEQMSDSNLDFTIPLDTDLPYTDVWSGMAAKFMFGPAYTYRARDFSQREFRYSPQSSAIDLTKPPEDVLAPDHLVPGIVDFLESTDIQDSFHATQEIVGGYGLFDLPIIRDTLKLNAGVRSSTPSSSSIRA